MSDDSKTAFEMFADAKERDRADVKYEAWSATIEDWKEERPDDFQRMEQSDKFDWDKIGVEQATDRNGRVYLECMTGIVYSPGDSNGKQNHELAHEFASDYRDHIQRLTREMLA